VCKLNSDCRRRATEKKAEISSLSVFVKEVGIRDNASITAIGLAVLKRGGRKVVDDDGDGLRLTHSPN
jgi:hypothetical protein